MPLSSIPIAMREKYEVIASIINDFCDQYLDEEYADLSMRLLEKLCRKRPSPLLTGKPNTWACGIVYAIGSTNFLFDRTQPYHMTAKELAERFGLSKSTAGSKSGEICKLMKISTFDPDWTLPSKLGDNPYVWLFETNDGLVLDVRYAPRDIREALFNAGMIPFIPDDRADEVQQQKAEETESGEVLLAEVPPQDPDIPKKKKEQVIIEGQISFFDELPEEPPEVSHER